MKVRGLGQGEGDLLGRVLVGVDEQPPQNQEVGGSWGGRGCRSGQRGQAGKGVNEAGRPAGGWEGAGKGRP